MNISEAKSYREKVEKLAKYTTEGNKVSIVFLKLYKWVEGSQKSEKKIGTYAKSERLTAHWRKYVSF